MTLTYQRMGKTDRGQAHALFSQTMGYVAITAGLFAPTELTVGLLAAFGLLIGLAIAPTIAYYGSMDPRALWQAGGRQLGTSCSGRHGTAGPHRRN
jgi:hypothetical protein